MSQRDLIAELQQARITAPAEVRERVRLIAAADLTPTSRFTWRRALVVALPVAAAIAAAVVFTRPDAERTAQDAATVTSKTYLDAQTRSARGAAAPPIAQVGIAGKELAVPSSGSRVQRYDASLTLRVKGAEDVSDGVKQALRIVAGYGGYSTSVHASTRGKSASADLVLKVPRNHVREAVARLSALGTITGERVDVEDLQGGLNATDRAIARDQRTLRELRAQPQTDSVKHRIAVLTARIVRLQRASAEIRRAAHYATVQLHLATPPVVAHAPSGHGPFHWLVVALKWLGIGLLYVLVLGIPVLLLGWLAWLAVRTVSRRREDRLLSR